MSTNKRHTLLLLPGLHGTKELFAPLLRALPPWIDPISISYPLDHVSSYPDALDHILERVPIGEFTVLGDSYSGPLALLVARALPRQVRAVLLSATFVTNPLHPLLRWARVLAYGPIVSIAPVRLGAALMLTNGFSRSGALDLIVREVRTVRGRVLAARLRAAMRCDYRDVAAACAVPILYLRAGADRIVSERASRELLASNPAIQMHEVDAPHTLLLVNPREAADLITAFLERITHLE